jgi:hypothetical protein
MTSAKLYVCGSIGKDRLIREGFDVDETFRYTNSEPTYYRARDISGLLYDLYENETLDQVYSATPRSSRPFDEADGDAHPAGQPRTRSKNSCRRNTCQQRGLIAGASVEYRAVGRRCRQLPDQHVS